MAERGPAGGIETGSPRSRPRWFLLAVKGLVSLVLLYFVSRQVSWERIVERLNQVSVLDVLVALAPLPVMTLCVAFRWRVIAGAVARPIQLAESWTVAMIGTALDQVLVTLSGDAYRVWWLRKGAPSMTRAIAGVLLDRVAGVLAIALLVLAFAPRLASLGAAPTLAWAPASLAAALLTAFGMLLVLDRVPLDLSHNRWLAGFGTLSASARSVYLAPAVALPALGAALAVHVLASVCIAALAGAVGAGLGPLQALTLVPAVMLVSLLPISIGGWGVREGAMVLGLGLVGVDKSDALLISVLYGLGAVAIGLSGAALWLLGFPGRLRPQTQS